MSTESKPWNVKPLYQHLATAIDSHKRCEADVHKIRGGLGGLHESFLPLREEWSARWLARAEAMLACLPHGSGLDGDWAIDWEQTRENRIVLRIPYHHMDSNGYYCGWSDLRFVIRPSLLFGVQLSLTGTGRGNSDLADCLHESVLVALQAEHDSAEFAATEAECAGSKAG